jgi:hypothetical protein
MGGKACVKKWWFKWLLEREKEVGDFSLLGIKYLTDCYLGCRFIV